MQHIALLLDRFVEALIQHRRDEQARDEARGHGCDEHGVVKDEGSGCRVGAQNGADPGNEAGAHGSGLGGGLGTGLHAQDIPCDIRAKVLARHAGFPLDERTLLGWHASLALHPLVDGGRRDGEEACKSCLAANFFGGGSDGICVHGADDKASPYLVKALPYWPSGCESKAMLTGKELGAAIKDAIEKKGVRQNELARHFEVKPPSIQDWIKKGTISKDKLPELWAYFADVVGPEHWGLSQFPMGGIPEAAKAAPGERHVSESQWQMLQDFELLIDEDKHAIRATLRQKAAQVRKAFERLKEQYGIKDTVPNARVEATYGPPPPPPPTGAGSYTKITPVPAPRSQKHKVK